MIKEFQTFDDMDDSLTSAWLLLDYYFLGQLHRYGIFLSGKIATVTATATFYFAKSRQDIDLGGLSCRVVALLSYKFLPTTYDDAHI